MFERTVSSTAAGSAADAAAVEQMTAVLARLDRKVSDAERVDQIRALEGLKSAAAAAQARATADLAASQREEQAAAGLRSVDQGRGIAAQVGLARRESPVRGAQHLGLAIALVEEMPHTLAALTRGRLSEWRATLLARETACLSRADRARVDRELAGDPARLEQLGDRRLVAEAKRLAYRLDPHAALRRSRKAAGDRRVTCRPAPDTMAHLTALLPVSQAVAAHAALLRAADQHRAAGDARTRSQIMADTLVERLTGRSASRPAGVELQLVITDRTLLAGDPETAHLHGYGPVPAGWARDLISALTSDGTEGTHSTDTTNRAAATWVRRLFTHPRTGQLVAMESRRRRFPPGLARFLTIRDQICRTPWCEAPVRHLDHVIPHADGGPTTAANGQGLCERCNYAKQAPGWQTDRVAEARHTVRTRTPTGHWYHSTAPPLPGARARRSDRVDIIHTDITLAA